MPNRNVSAKPSYLKRSFRFLSDYFLTSDNKWKARALFLGCILSTVALIGLGFFIGWWCFPSISAAFLLKDSLLLLQQVGICFFAAAVTTGVNYLSTYLKNKLSVSWGVWLKRKILNQYLNNEQKNYLKISRAHADIDNPDQRIQEIDTVVESLMELTLGFIENFANLVLYTTLLGLAGSTLTFMVFSGTIVIPGFLVFAALGVGIITSVIGYFINRSLNKSANEEIVAQANLRSGMGDVINFPEETALEQGGKYYQARLEERVEDIATKKTKRLSIQNGTASFNLFNVVSQWIISYLVTAPLYFKDLMTLGTVSSVGYYFTKVTNSLNWFINSFHLINKFKTSLDRILQLHQVMDQNNEPDSTEKIIRICQPENSNLDVSHLHLNAHGSEQLVIKGFNLRFTRGLNTLIQAPSGTGKSSLFKAIAGTWLSGEGKVSIPTVAEKMYFLPQKPTLPKDTLRNVLAYPDSHCEYTDAELTAALQAVRMGSIVDRLDKPIGFKSLGEQQRIAFARVLLKKPDWLFLDEATASLDEELEQEMYCILKDLLPNTTLISIGHRNTLRDYHSRHLLFSVDQDKQVQCEEILAGQGLARASAAGAR